MILYKGDDSRYYVDFQVFCENGDLRQFTKDMGADPIDPDHLVGVQVPFVVPDDYDPCGEMGDTRWGGFIGGQGASDECTFCDWRDAYFEITAALDEAPDPYVPASAPCAPRNTPPCFGLLDPDRIELLAFSPRCPPDVDLEETTPASHPTPQEIVVQLPSGWTNSGLATLIAQPGACACPARDNHCEDVDGVEVSCAITGCHGEWDNVFSTRDLPIEAFTGSVCGTDFFNVVCRRSIRLTITMSGPIAGGKFSVSAVLRFRVRSVFVSNGALASGFSPTMDVYWYGEFDYGSCGTIDPERLPGLALPYVRTDLPVALTIGITKSVLMFPDCYFGQSDVAGLIANAVATATPGCRAIDCGGTNINTLTTVYDWPRPANEAHTGASLLITGIVMP
jgi:hypothetical protein